MHEVYHTDQQQAAQLATKLVKQLRPQFNFHICDLKVKNINYYYIFFNCWLGSESMPSILVPQVLSTALVFDTSLMLQAPMSLTN